MTRGEDYEKKNKQFDTIVVFRIVVAEAYCRLVLHLLTLLPRMLMYIVAVFPAELDVTYSLSLPIVGNFFGDY